MVEKRMPLPPPKPVRPPSQPPEAHPPAEHPPREPTPDLTHSGSSTPSHGPSTPPPHR
jgi:hypothetical protein